MKIKYINDKMDLRTKLNTEYNEMQFEFRKYNKIPKESFVVTGWIEEAFWWNRPTVEDAKEFITEEPDGFMAMNLPYWGLKNNPDVNLFKTKYNFLIPKNSIIFASFIKYDKTWNEERKIKLREFFKHLYKDSLASLGLPAESLDYSASDLYYSGKKFGGIETIETAEGFSHNVCITCQMLPEKEIFDRLKGKYAHHTQITGISEESNLTREAILKELEKRILKFFKAL